MITINLDKAKTIAHDMRRTAREVEFTPLDKKATIPSMAVQAEIDRQQVRDKYAVMQVAMDAATSVDALKLLLPTKDL
jgi:hypothetical protein